MNKLDIAKEIIKENYHDATCGLYDCRNILGDPMTNIYEDDEFCIDICYPYAYFEVFGLSKTEFKELSEFYDNIEE